MFIQYGAKINSCNYSFDETMHAPQCAGHCDKIELSELDVDLHNEAEHWKQAEMYLQGVPDTQPAYPVQGIGIDLLQLDTQVKALLQILEIDPTEFSTKCKEVMLARLRRIRTAHESEQILSDLLVPKPTIFMPRHHLENGTEQP